MRALGLLVALAGCGGHVPPNPPTPFPQGIPACPQSARAPSFNDSTICRSFTAPDLYPCLRCPEAHGCFNTALKVYCIQGDFCGLDRYCGK